MISEQRKYPRFTPKGVHADIVISNLSNHDSIHLEGSMLDISYSGIRIKLQSEMPHNLPDSNVKIVLKLPNSEVRCTITGLIRHIHDDSEVGLHYAEHHEEQEVDDFMFECVKHIAHHC